MKYEIECSKCEHKIIFTNKDLHKLSSSDTKVRQDYADGMLDILKGKKKKLKLLPFPHFEIVNYQKTDWLDIAKTANQIKAQKYFIQCGICNQEIAV